MANGSGGPLEGLRVIELAALGPAPFAALLLAELGADVVRVDRPAGRGGPSGPVVTSGLNRSRPNVAVDLRADGGAEVVLRLVAGADVLIEGMRPGVAERLGVGPAACLARNPRLVYGRMTGWGQDGPWAAMAGHDITYAAITGALHLAGGPDKPAPPANLLADFGGGTLYLLVGVLAALQARSRTGRGQVVDAAMVDGSASLLTMLHALAGAGHWRPERGVNLLDGGAPFYDTYRCADGRFVAVGALEPQFYTLLLDGLGLSFAEGQYDTGAWPRHRAAFAAAFATRTRDEWAERFAGTDACVAPVLSLAEAPSHPHLAARGVFVDVAGVLQPRVAPRFSDTRGLDPTPEHAPGADTVVTLRANGFGADEIAALLESGAVQQATEADQPSRGATGPDLPYSRHDRAT
jgi:alpha-methylacyl-CoA racemase